MYVCRYGYASTEPSPSPAINPSPNACSLHQPRPMRTYLALYVLTVLVLCQMASSFSQQQLFRLGGAETSLTSLHLHKKDDRMMDRSQFLQTSFKGIIATLFIATADPRSSVALPSYSSNARNMERLASGDASGGSSYDNFPKSEASKKRRAITGCKIPSARREAGISSSSLSEKDCNMRVLSGETDFMLQAIRKLDCPTCPYGIDPK